MAHIPSLLHLFGARMLSSL